MLSLADDLRVRIERGRSSLRVSASTPEADLKVEVTFSGGADGVWFRLSEAGTERVFPREVVESHPPLSAILRLIGDEAELSKSPSEALLGLLFQSLRVYV